MGVCPVGFVFTFPQKLIETLQNKYHIKGFFFVRQKRIPNILCQGLSIGVDRVSYIPMLYYNNNYITESFINSELYLSTSYNERILNTNNIQSSGLLSVDAITNKQLQSVFDNSEFILEKNYKVNTLNKDNNKRYYYIDNINYPSDKGNISKAKCVYIDTDIPLKYYDSCGFSTRVGSSEDCKDIRFIGSKNYEQSNSNIVRGIYCPFIGTNKVLDPNYIYNIRSSNYSSTFNSEYFKIRGNDLSPFMAISPRYELNDSKLIKIYDEDQKIIERITPTVFRGDCFTNTVTVRIIRNFIDSETPTNDIIVDPETWKNGYKGYNQTTTSD
jgi:hypothetical protein